MSFYGVTDLWTFVAGAIGIVLLPGPNSLYVLSVATVRGVRAGYQGAMGIFVGDTLLLLATALGAVGLLRSYPALFTIIKYAGAAYLAWVGINLILAAFRKLRSGALESAAEPAIPANLQAPFRRALWVSLLNPKAILFLLSFFVQFIDPNYDSTVIPFLILSGIIMSFSAIYLSVLIFLGARLAQTFRAHKRLSASLSSAVGGMFLWFGSKLATASLN